ncbi:MAG TPA: TonB-dependent receptor [Vicinamibacterales bacterium]|nr:TonB-dependent receptor [Vicinamibacterales bacterium]
MKSFKIAGLMFAMLALAAFPAAAQSTSTGTLTGLVKDAAGGVLPGVTVTAAQPQAGVTRTVTTGSQGEWTVATLPPGEYTLTFELAAFKRQVRPNVVVEAGVPRSVNVTLEIGAISESITVQGGVELLTPTTATAFRRLSADELTLVPTTTRSFTHLLSSEAGVSAELPPVLVNGTGNISPSVNGTRTTSTSLFFNGIDATNFTSNEGSLTDNINPAPETLEEVKLQTSLYDAATGRSGGGNFQLITKSGSNLFKGVGYYNFQHEKMNANEFFYELDGIEKPKARRDEGGFTIGGPIRRNRFFFFGGYQRTQADTGFVPTASSITVLPAALGLIQGARTKESLHAAFTQLNPNFATSVPRVQCASASDNGCISDVALALFNLRNPVTGDYVIPAPRAGLSATLVDATSAGGQGGNPLVRQRNVVPAEFQQDQYNARVDSQVTRDQRLSVTGFYADFPALDPFPDPSSLASPFTLRRADKNATLALSDTMLLNDRTINEVRAGVFALTNTRRLDDPFLSITNASVGIPNPANNFDNSAATTRLGHYVGRPGTAMERFSFGGPNDTFNRRRQRTYTIGDTLTWTTGRHAVRFGGEYRRNEFDTNLPEEQATEFEKFDNFTQLLRGLGSEGDTQFGVTDKRFRFQDFNGFLSDDWRLSNRFTLNVGLRYEFFGWPEELDGRIGNVDFAAITDTENPANAFIVPNNVNMTGFAAIDEAIGATRKANNGHTLKGQDWDNVAPRLGFAWTADADGKTVVRGGYGIFYDRPSSAFINTVFSNYPFLREIEVTAPSRLVPLATAFSQQNPLLGLNHYLPNRVARATGPNGVYEIRDATGVTRGADGTANRTDPVTGLPILGNVAETFEFRAISRDLETPWVEQYGIGIQRQLGSNLMLEARYVGSRGHKLLESRAFNQGFDLNDPSTPDYIFERFNKAYLEANSPNGPLNAGATARERGFGKAFGFLNSATGRVDYNLSTAATTVNNVIPFEARAPILGFNIPEAVLLDNTAHSLYHSLQLNLLKRLSNGLQFNLSYTYSRSKDTSSADPGSTAGAGKPDVPNVGFAAQGDQRNLEANYALSDFDRPHRFSGSFVYELPWGGVVRGVRVSGFVQLQSGLPYSIFSAEPESQNATQFTSVRLGSGGLYRAAFGRPSLCGTVDELRRSANDPWEGAFNASVLCSPQTAAGGYPDNLGFGNLGRNVLRGLWQRRVDLSLSKTLKAGRTDIEVKWDIFNLLNTVNFALPNNVIGDAGTDFGLITETIGGPRVMQLGLKVRF